jgi:hypothetical protein
MFIRPCYRTKDGKMHAYWALVESVRTPRGPRQRVVTYLGQMDRAGRIGVQEAASGNTAHQGRLDGENQPRWVQVDVKGIRVERCLELGGPWLGLELMKRLGLTEFLERALPPGPEQVPWSLTAAILVLSRLCEPSSELHIAEQYYRQTAMADLLGVPAARVNDDRLYRALDQLLPHKEALEVHLKNRLGELFDLDYELLLYDVTSTYFEGLAEGNALAQRGYSRDHRGDCQQVCIALVVARGGMPLGYEVFAGNRGDVTTVQEIVTTMERRYGQADRIWVMDRGMISRENIEFLKAGGRKYIVGTPKGMLRQFERHLLEGTWQQVQEGVQVKRVPSPEGEETFLLCRSDRRRDKEKAMHERFERRIEQGLLDLQKACLRCRQNPVRLAKRLGKLLGHNSRAAGLFKTDVLTGPDGWTWLDWSRVEAWRDWANLSEGCYLLRSNVKDWSGQDLWKAYIQLTDAEAAFRIDKSDLKIRPVWHQKTDRVLAHILVCFLAYVLWKTLGQLCHQAHLGDEPRRVLEELRGLRVVDLLLPTRDGVTIRRRCIARPTDHQAILLQRLGLTLPTSLEVTDAK